MYAIIKDKTIINIIEADEAFAQSIGAVILPENAQIGDKYINGELIPVNRETISESVPFTEIDIETLRKTKLTEINSACTSAIHLGIDVETTQGTEHFSLTENDQINLSSVYQQARAGYPAVLYHADGKLCRMFSADEITAIMTAATMHKTYHTTYCNHLHIWINRCDSVDELQGIFYGSALPDDLQANLDEILGAIA